MNEHGRVAVILVNYDGWTDTARCLRSLKDSIVPLEVVLVDNGSTEPVPDQAFGDLHPYHLIRSERNRGFGGGNNLALRWVLAEIGCPFIWLLNNDTVVAPDAALHLERALHLNSRAAAASPRIVFLDDPDTLWYGGGEINWWTGSARIPGYRGPAGTPAALHARDVTFASGCAFFLRRSVVARIGGFDSRFFMYEEDVELGLRLQGAGWSIRYVPDALVYHRGQGAQRADGAPFLPIQHPSNPRLPFFAYHTTKNRLLNMALHAHGSRRFQFALGFPLFLGQRAILFALKGRLDAVQASLRGALAFWRERRRKNDIDLFLDTP